jgi:catechol 2,3-dioxygenase-like lactoylglutathione lyase family enzyme
MPTPFLHVRLRTPASLLLELTEFYGSHLGLRVAQPKAGGVAVEVGETVLELLPAPGSPFYHFALLAPGDRFEAALDWARDHVDILPDRETGHAVFDFTTWDAKACYFLDPAGNIVELIAHRGVEETGAAGAFAAGELLGVSEIGLVGDPAPLAAELERGLGLELWDGAVDGQARLAFLGEKARTLILCHAGRPWLPTGRPAEAHPVEVVVQGSSEGPVALGGGGWVRRRETRETG